MGLALSDVEVFVDGFGEGLPLVLDPRHEGVGGVLFGPFEGKVLVEIGLHAIITLVVNQRWAITNAMNIIINADE